MPSQEFFIEDTVALKQDPSILALVHRTWHDVDSGRFSRPSDWIAHSGISKRVNAQCLRDGQIPRGHAIIKFVKPLAGTSLVAEKSLLLIDRGLEFGDVVKKESSDAQSGTVIGTSVQCTLQPVYNGSPFHTNQSWPKPKERLLYQVQAGDLQFVDDYAGGDYIIYHDWVGEIQDYHCDIAIRLKNGSVVVVEDEDELSEPSFDEQDIETHDSLAKSLRKLQALTFDNCNVTILPLEFYPGQYVSTKKGNLRRGKWVLGSYNPTIEPRGTIVDIRVTQLEVEWLTCNVFDANRANKAPPPEMLDYGDFSEITRYKQARYMGSDMPVVSGDYVCFKDLVEAEKKYTKDLDGSVERHFQRIPRSETQGYDMNYFVVLETKTMITVQWQDASVSEHLSTSLFPFLNVDEHELWPGEIVSLKSEESLDDEHGSGVIMLRQVGVVQTTNAKERLASVRWFADPKVGIFDEHKSTLVPGSSLGPLSSRESQVSVYEIDAYPALTRRRGDLVLIAQSKEFLALHSALALQRASTDVDVAALSFPVPGLNMDIADVSMLFPGSSGMSSIESQTNWFGEVVDLGRDGLLRVRLGTMEQPCDLSIPVERILLVVGGDDDSAFGGSVQSDEPEVLTDSGESSDGSDALDNDSDEMIEETIEYEGGTRLDIGGDEELWTTDDESDGLTPDNGLRSKADPHPTPVDAERIKPELATQKPYQFSRFDSMPDQFTILNTQFSPDHPFAKKATHLSGPLLRRIRKEHSILKSSLPDSIWVRTWEDRLDVLRVLIVGPLQTPYEHAPFVIDFLFHDGFPYSPPEAYFHSWTNGVGRINPNLYEDGKICLSLLGTWPQDNRNEGWSSERSSMLQLIVSIMGLVLVREPYYNEAGFDALIGTEDSRVNSIFYSEKALVMSKGFVVHALSHRVSGLDEVIGWLYCTEDGPRLLQRIVRESQELLGNEAPSTSEQADDRTITAADNGKTRLSSGARVLFKKYLNDLEQRLIDANSG